MYVRPRSGPLRSSRIKIIIKVGVAVSGPSPRFTRWLAVPSCARSSRTAPGCYTPRSRCRRAVSSRFQYRSPLGQPSGGHGGPSGRTGNQQRPTAVRWTPTPGEFRQPGWMRVLRREDRSRVSDALGRTLSRVRHTHMTRGL